MSWHLLIPLQIMKYLFEPEAAVPFLVYSTKFIQQSFIEYFSVPDPGLGTGGPQRNEPQSLSLERSLSAGERWRVQSSRLPGGGVASSGLKEAEGLPRR